MKRAWWRGIMVCLLASQTFAADDPQKTIDALQVALQQSQAQTAQANQVQLQMAVTSDTQRREIEALRKQLADAKPKEPAK